uniref:Uncharacterized protein n=1 Tax=Parascaris equorum TaxID=6256 RepID=A0A914RF59_PAREQ
MTQRSTASGVNVVKSPFENRYGNSLPCVAAEKG